MITAWVRIEGNWDDAVSGGLLCEVGRFDPMDDNRERILTPMLKKDGSTKATTWDDALAAIKDQLKSAKGKAAAVVSTRFIR